MRRAAATTLFVLVAACGDNVDEAAPRDPLAPCATCSSVFVAAHQDDDLLFMDPDIADAIGAGYQVTVAWTTAGDLGEPDSDGYWIDRERGSIAAYSFLLGDDAITAYDSDRSALPDGWTASIVTLGTLQAAQYQRANVTLVFFRLTDFQEQCLYEQIAGCSGRNPNPAPPYVAITRACPGNADACPGGTALAEQQVTRDALVGALAAVLDRAGAQELGALDATDLHVDMLGEPIYTGAEAGYTDYWDHVYSGKLAIEAALRAAAPPALRLYRGYTLHRAPVDLDIGTARLKQQVFARYAMFDAKIVPQPTPSNYLDDLERHLAGDYKLGAAGSWERRQYSDASAVTASGALRSASLDLGAGWTFSGDQLSDGSGCLAVGSAGDGEIASCGGANTALYLFDSGQVRAANDLCLAGSSGGPSWQPCAAAPTADHAAGDVPADDQLWELAP